jgi:putative membrane protein
MIATWVFGLLMLMPNWAAYKTQGWLHIKLALVVLLTIYHFCCGYYRKKLINNAHYKNHVFWRWFNEAPTIALVIVVCLVIVKPQF